MKGCIFCNISEREIMAENELAVAFYDKYPVNEGHTLIITKRHVETLFEADLDELAAINRLIFDVKRLLDERYGPDGYNVGVNVGEAAGQTIFHLHYHVIPRYLGDVANPRGGIRRVKKSIIPYWAEGEKGGGRAP